MVLEKKVWLVVLQQATEVKNWQITKYNERTVRVLARTKTGARDKALKKTAGLWAVASVKKERVQ